VPHRSLAVQSTAHANAYTERLIGSIHRECLDHIIIGNERGLCRVLHAYVEYYLKFRTHCRSAKMRPCRDRSRHRATARSWPFRSSVACTTITSAARR